MKVTHSILAPLLIGVSFFVTTSILAEDVPIVQERKALGTIVIPEDASGQLRKSAEFLRDYVAKATGATLPIETAIGEGPSIHVGSTALAKVRQIPLDELGGDGFVLKRVDAKNFLIVGGSDWGTEYGVYDFLERYLGVRWLAPTELFTDVPNRSNLTLPEGEVKEMPTFLSREMYPINVVSDPSDSRRASGPLWYRLGDEWGRVNRLRANVEFHHNLKDLLPPSKFAVSNPEFYPILNGKRFIPPDDDSYQWQPNFSAPNIAKASADEIIACFDKHPEKNSYSLGINDSYRFDESDESKARRNGRKNSISLEDVSDDYIQWANEVVDLVHEKYPGKLLGLLAYLQVLEPPTKVKVSPFIVPFITYENTRWEDPEYRNAMQKITLAWGEAAPTLGWYDYVYGASYQVPRFFPHAEQKALVWGAEHQVKYYYAEATPNWGEGPNIWVLSKLIWNPRQDVDSLLADWYQAAVGLQAAPKLAEYYRLWEKFWGEDILASRWYSATNLWADYTNDMYLVDVPLKYLEQSDRLMDEVVALADTPVRKERAEVLRRMWKIYQASTLARQGDELWKRADILTAADAEAYVEQCKAVIESAETRLRLMSELSDDPLLGHSIFRITMTSLGDNWGASSLWPLLPWVSKSEKVQQYLESVSAKNEENTAPVGKFYSNEGRYSLWHKAPKIAQLVLDAGQGKAKQFLKNPSFEDGAEGWSKGSYKVTSQKALEGKSSLRVSGGEDAVLVQDIPYHTGAYVAKVTAMGSDGYKEGKVTVSVTALNDEGSQIGVLLPTASMIIHPNKWSSLMIPFLLETYSAPATILRLKITFEGVPANEAVYLDDMAILQADDVKRVRSGVGPDGE